MRAILNQIVSIIAWMERFAGSQVPRNSTKSLEAAKEGFPNASVATLLQQRWGLVCVLPASCYTTALFQQSVRAVLR